MIALQEIALQSSPAGLPGGVRNRSRRVHWLAGRRVRLALGVSLALHAAAAIGLLALHLDPELPSPPPEISVALVAEASAPVPRAVVDPVEPPDTLPLPDPPPQVEASAPVEMQPVADAPPPATAAPPPVALAAEAPLTSFPSRSEPPIPPAARSAYAEPHAIPRAEPRPSRPVPAPDLPVALNTPTIRAPVTKAPVVSVPPRPVSGMSSNRPPIYPALAQRRGEAGVVILRVAVTVDGQPASVAISRSSGYPALDDAAAAAVRQWRFVPASSNGAPVAASADVPIEFRIPR